MQKKFLSAFMNAGPRILFIALCAIASQALAQQSITNSIGMRFVWIQPGRMTVGEFRPPYPTPADTVKGGKRTMVMYMGEGRGYNTDEFVQAKALAERDTRDGFQVKIKRGFYLGTYEVTQAQWQRVMGNNPSSFAGANSDDRPVENVTWAEAQAFIAKLNRLEPASRYRLPSEFEWEYAARAGATQDISWSLIEQMANLNKTHTIRVGQKLPNAWGLYDMLGNVWEWVDDYYNEKLFADRKPPVRVTVHVLKGASFVGDVKNATYMTHAGGPGNGWDVGFRIVREQP